MVMEYLAEEPDDQDLNLSNDLVQDTNIHTPFTRSAAKSLVNSNIRESLVESRIQTLHSPSNIADEEPEFDILYPLNVKDSEEEDGEHKEHEEDGEHKEHEEDGEHEEHEEDGEHEEEEEFKTDKEKQKKMPNLAKKKNRTIISISLCHKNKERT